MYRGLYLNLERSGDRLALLQQHLREAGALERYERFGAIDGRDVCANYQTSLDPGNLGLWLSHLTLIDAHRHVDTHLHLIEDDIWFSRGALPRFEQSLARADAEFPQWDLLFTDLIPSIDTQTFVTLGQRVIDHSGNGSIHLLPLDGVTFAGASSFFINRRSLAKYADLIAGQWTQGQPFDIFLRDLVARGSLRGLVTVPFLTTVSRQSVESTIRGSLHHSHRVTEIYRQSFFIDAEHASLARQIGELTREAKVLPLTWIYVQAQYFAFSDRWQVF